MIVLPKIETEQKISFIPLNLKAKTIIITNEQTKVEQIFTPKFFKNDYYLSCFLIIELIENQFYNFEVKDANNNTLYIDKLLCRTT